MLYLVSSLPDLHPGTYQCKAVTHEQAVEYILAANDSKSLESYITFGSARHAIRKLCGIKVEVAQKGVVPRPADGDVFLQMRVAEKPESGRPELKDMVFFEVNYSSNL